MNRFSIVFAHEFKETVKSKSFKIISVILAVILAVMCICVGFIALDDGGGSGPETEVGPVSDPSDSDVAVADLTGGDTGEKLANLIGANLIESTDEAGYTNLVESGEYNSVVVLSRREDGGFSFALYEKTSLYGESIEEAVTENLLMLRRLELLEEKGVDENDAALILVTNDVAVDHHPVGEVAFAGFIVSFFVMIMMFICITLYGQLVATNVATEKSTRTMELLVTSASPRSLLMGKVLGTGAAAIVQISVFALSAAAIAAVGAGASPAISAVLSMVMTLSAADVLYLIAYFALGFLLIAFVYGALGSVVNQVEDLSALMGLPTTVFMIGYFIAVMMSSSGGVSDFARVCSFIPFWSPMVMTVRMAVEEVPHGEVIISLLIQGCACAVVALIASKVYRMGTLLYGKTPKLSEIARLMRNK